jgi:hypothetical protein
MVAMMGINLNAQVRVIIKSLQNMHEKSLPRQRAREREGGSCPELECN